MVSTGFGCLLGMETNLTLPSQETASGQEGPDLRDIGISAVETTVGSEGAMLCLDRSVTIKHRPRSLRPSHQRHDLPLVGSIGEEPVHGSMPELVGVDMGEIIGDGSLGQHLGDAPVGQCPTLPDPQSIQVCVSVGVPDSLVTVESR